LQKQYTIYNKTKLNLFVQEIKFENMRKVAYKFRNELKVLLLVIIEKRMLEFLELGLNGAHCKFHDYYRIIPVSLTDSNSTKGIEDSFFTFSVEGRWCNYP